MEIRSNRQRLTLVFFLVTSTGIFVPLAMQHWGWPRQIAVLNRPAAAQEEFFDPDLCTRQPELRRIQTIGFPTAQAWEISEPGPIRFYLDGRPHPEPCYAVLTTEVFASGFVANGIFFAAIAGFASLRLGSLYPRRTAEKLQ